MAVTKFCGGGGGIKLLLKAIRPPRVTKLLNLRLTPNTTHAQYPGRL